MLDDASRRHSSGLAVVVVEVVVPVVLPRADGSGAQQLSRDLA